MIISFLIESFLIERAIRFNIKGKKYINTLAKYYFTDLGLRNAQLSFRQLEETHLMENAIYNELVARGYRVDVGAIEVREPDKSGHIIRKQLEVDFVANRADQRIYVQSALSIPTEEKMRQEKASLRRVNDGFKKVIVVKEDVMPYYDGNGTMIVGLFDFLLGRVDL